MKDPVHRLPFRWVLPAVQLLLCVLALWPSRYFLLFEISQSIDSYGRSQSREAASSPVNIDIPKLTPEQQDAADRSAGIEYLRMRVPVALNLPVGIAQLPYVIANPAKREWVPKGMMTETWRAISWPIGGVLFWWSVGRAIEALGSVRKGVIAPRVTLVETVIAAVFVCLGFVVLIGMLTSTTDDRRDIQYIALLVGGLLWGILASITIVARICQWRVRKSVERAEALA